MAQNNCGVRIKEKPKLNIKIRGQTEALVNYDTDVDIAGKLYTASGHGNEDEVDHALIDSGVHINKTDDVKAASFCVAQHDNVNISDDQGKFDLFYVVQQSNSESVVHTLIDAGADVNVTDKDGETVLFRAVHSGNETIVKTLIYVGADVNVTDKDDNIALFYAVCNDNETIVKTLIDAGADVNVTDKHGETALIYAVRNDNETIVKTLIDAGADVNVTDKDGETVLFRAVRSGNETMVKTLIYAGADVNVTDKDGETALFQAAYFDNETIVKTLIDAGADVNVTDKDGETALFQAVHNDNETMVKTLIDAGADINVTDKDGETALFYAVLNDNVNVVHALIENRNLFINSRDGYGRTPLFYAMTQSLTLVHYLIDKKVSMHLKDNCSVSVLSFFIENCMFKKFDWSSLGLTISERIGLFIQKGVKRKTVLETIMNVIFCKSLLLLSPFAPDLTTISLVLELAKTYITDEKEQKERIIDEVLMLMRETANDKIISANVMPKILDLLFELGADPNSADSDGNTALHYATHLPFYGVPEKTIMDILKKLEVVGVIFNLKNHKSETPLLFCLSKDLCKKALQNNYWTAVKILIEVCRFLIQHGSKVEDSTLKGNSVFHLILEIFQQLLAWHDTCSSRSIDILTEGMKLMQLFSSVSIAKRVVNVMNVNLNSPLHLLASLEPAHHHFSTFTDERSGFTVFFKVILDNLLKCRAQLNARNEEEQTPLHVCRTWTAVKLLIDAGANPNVVDSSGSPPLLVAAKNEIFLEQVDSFYPDTLLQPKEFWISVLKRGLDPWTVDKHGKSVLTILMKSKSYNLARGLIEVTCDINSQLESRELIMFSFLTTICKDETTNADWKYQIIEKILCTTKCPVNGNSNEDSPLHFCCRNIIEASKGLSDDRIKTTVHWAIAQQLLLNGADCTIPDARGQTCLDIAEACPALKDLLMQPIDLDRIPPLITKWKSVSKTHKTFLSKVARHLQSKQVDVYWYHKAHLARGSFGAVFAGINEKDGREVAIKRIEKLRMQRPEDKRERTNLALLGDCEQVVHYLHFFEEEEFSYIVLELMEGNLCELLGNKITIETRAHLCQDVVMGLNFLHCVNIIHRDLKPTNILYGTCPKLCLKIADFGLSRCIDGSSSTVYSGNVGTRCWIAPEILITSKSLSKSSDIFSCGLVLHYILSVKKHPFTPADCMKKSAMQINHETEANILCGKMEGWDNSLCPEAKHLVNQLLESKETERPTAKVALAHPLFWSKKKKIDLLIAVGNQREFECTRAKRSTLLTAVETDLETKFTTIVKYANWNDPRYVHMPAIYTEMTKKRKYKTNSVVELVIFIRNAYCHVSERKQIRKLLLEDFVILDYFPNLVIEVFKAVTTHGWDKREEIKYALKQELTRIESFIVPHHWNMAVKPEKWKFLS